MNQSSDNMRITENTIKEFAIELLQRLGCQSRRDETYVTKETTQEPSSVGAKQKRLNG